MDIRCNHTSFPLMVISPAFQDSGHIPARFTDDGENLSPPLIWANATRGTGRFAITCEDIDSPDGDFIHWLLYNIPASMDHVDEGVRHFHELENGAVQGTNDFGDIGYGGPSPPIGKPHRYVFTVYAMDRPLELRPGATKNELQKAMQGHVIGMGKLTGVYVKGSGRDSKAGAWDSWLTGSPKNAQW